MLFWNVRARNTHVEATLNHPFAAQAAQDRNANFVSDLKRELVGGADAREKAAGDKMAAAAAYLAKKGGAPGDARAKAAAYLAAKQQAP